MFRSMKKDTGMICVLVLAVLVPFTHGLPRLRRQGGCEYGTYNHKGNTCCKCPKGFRVQSHCTASDQHSKCEHCMGGSTYTADANSQTDCDICSVCNAKANLEVVRSCSVTADTVCGCQDGYFCEGDNCRACHVCDSCEWGEKVPCSRRNNTVCNENPEGGNSNVVIAVVLLIMVVVVGVTVLLYLRWKKMFCFGKKKPAEDPNKDQEEEPLNGIDLKPHVPEIVEELSWSDMAKVAGRTGMTHVQMQRHRSNHPNNEEEQLTSLLHAWIELKGLEQASGTLIQTLRTCKLNQKASNIQRILRGSRPAAESGNGQVDGL